MSSVDPVVPAAAALFIVLAVLATIVGVEAFLKFVKRR